MVLNLTNLTDASIIRSSTLSSLSDGAYDVQLSYRDSVGNAAAYSAKATSVTLSTHTMNPTLMLPVASATYNNIPVAYTLPESALAGSVMLILSGAGGTDTLGMIDT